MDHLGYFCLVLLCFHVRLFDVAMCSPAGKGLTSWLSFVMSNCDVVTFPLVSWVRRGAWLYRFLIFALFLTFTTSRPGQNNVLQPSYHSDEMKSSIALIWSTRNLLVVDSFYLVITACLYFCFLTHKAPPIICSRRKFQILPLFKNNK